MAERLGELAAGDLHVQVEDVAFRRAVLDSALGPEGGGLAFEEQPSIDLVADDHTAVKLEAVVRILDESATRVELEPGASG